MKKISKFVLKTFFVLFVLIFILIGWHWHSDIPKHILREKYATFPSRFIEIQGMEVHFREDIGSCDSLPLVLLHGTGASLHTWDGWVKELGSKHRIIRMDLPAFGLTGANPQGDYSIDFYVNFLHDFLKKTYIEKCVLVGNSLGGSIAWNFAIKYPNMVKKLVLVDAAGFSTPSKERPLAFRIAEVPVLNQLVKYVTPRLIIERSILNVYGDKRKVTDSLVNRYFELSLHEGNREAFLARMSMKLSSSNAQLIKTITVPTLILWGEEDRLIPIESAYKFADALPNDSLVIFKGIGHVPMEEAPELTAKVMQDFLKNK
jgi:pimeloyl-ACP methyl ester carboxylesterase